MEEYAKQWKLYYTPQAKTVLVRYGIVGSGKTYCLDLVMTKLGQSPQLYPLINLDTIIMNHPKYKELYNRDKSTAWHRIGKDEGAFNLFNEIVDTYLSKNQSFSIEKSRMNPNLLHGTHNYEYLIFCVFAPMHVILQRLQSPSYEGRPMTKQELESNAKAFYETANLIYQHACIIVDNSEAVPTILYCKGSVNKELVAKALSNTKLEQREKDFLNNISNHAKQA